MNKYIGKGNLAWEFFSFGALTLINAFAPKDKGAAAATAAALQVAHFRLKDFRLK